MADEPVHPDSLEADLLADHRLHPHHRCFGADGGDHPTVVTKEFNYGGVAHMLSLGESIVYAVGIALGFAMALIIFAGIREHIDLMEPPKGMKGTPIALITAGILALAFMGFTGIV